MNDAKWVRELLDELLEVGRERRDALIVENVQLILLTEYGVRPIEGGCPVCGGLLAFCYRDDVPACRRRP